MERETIGELALSAHIVGPLIEYTTLVNFTSLSMWIQCLFVVGIQKYAHFGVYN